MEIKRSTIVISGLGILMIALSFMFYNQNNLFLFIFGLGLITVFSPYVIKAINENRIDAEKEEMFIEFARNLVESVKTGTPISKSIINSRNKNYGVLTQNVKKLANQISLGIPLSQALETFSKDVDNKMVSRTLVLIGQAEKAGGDIGEILESVAGAVSASDKLKKERRAAISTLVVQGYIIFIVFIIIILVMQFKIIPLLSGIGNLGGGGVMGISAGGEIDAEGMARSFLFLLIIQGLFSGLAIGKLAEGNIKSGIKHSFALIILSFLISAGANLIFG